MASDEEFEELLTPAECAALWKVDPKTITRWAKKGLLTSVRTLGGHRRYKKAEVMALLNPVTEKAPDPLAAPVHLLWPRDLTGPARALLGHLQGAGVATIGDLAACNEGMLDEFGLRPAQIDHVRLVLARKGLTLRGEILGKVA